jgi:hypothetical protein
LLRHTFASDLVIPAVKAYDTMYFERLKTDHITSDALPGGYRFVFLVNSWGVGEKSLHKSPTS